MQKFLFILTLLIYQLAFSQERESSICGKVLDNTGQPSPYAAVMLMQGETVVNGAYTDEDGCYLIKPVELGIYDIKVQFLEAIQVIADVKIEANQEKVVDITFQKVCYLIENIPISCGFGRLIPKSQPSGILLNQEDIQKMADRKLSAPTSLATGVYVPIK